MDISKTQMSADLKIWCAFPTANTAAANHVLRQWTDQGYRTAVYIDQRQEAPKADIVVEGSGDFPGFAVATNRLCHMLLEGQQADIIVIAGDDLHPDPALMAQEIGDVFKARFPDFFGVMQPMGDQYGALHPRNPQKAAVSPWIGRTFITRMYSGQGPYFTGYKHLWADTELWEVADRMRVMYANPDVTQYHAHYTRGHEDNLPVEKRRKIEAANSHDCNLFNERKAQGFPCALDVELMGAV